MLRVFQATVQWARVILWYNCPLWRAAGKMEWATLEAPLMTLLSAPSLLRPRVGRHFVTVSWLLRREWKPCFSSGTFNRSFAGKGLRREG
jgi:hypothetical protein